MTDDPYITAIIQAQRIYALTGIPTQPWSVGEWPDDWLDAIRAYSVDVGRKAKAIKNTSAPMKRKGR